MKGSIAAVPKGNLNKNFAILVDLSEERLYLIDKEKNIILKKYTIASGKTDTPSPIGTWKVVGKDRWSGGFGTRWIGLNVPWGKFGIHGTNRPGSNGSFEKGLRILKSGDRGSAVLEIQKKMKEKGYYPGNLDVIYGEGMKFYVMKFRKDNDLSIIHDIDKDFYKKLGITFVILD